MKNSRPQRPETHSGCGRAARSGRDALTHDPACKNGMDLSDRLPSGRYGRPRVLFSYLDDFAALTTFDNPFLFRDTILKLVEGDALTFKELPAAK